MAGFFPIFFKQYWSQEGAITESTFYLGVGNSVASLVIVLLAPLLGAMADTGGLRKRMLSAFATIGVVATGALYLVEAGMWPFAILLYAIAVIGFSGANTFYDALLIIVAPAGKRHRISALGFSLGWGGGLLFLINVLMTLQPQWFGLASAAEGGSLVIHNRRNLVGGLFHSSCFMSMNPCQPRAALSTRDTFAARFKKSAGSAWMFLLASFLLSVPRLWPVDWALVRQDHRPSSSSGFPAALVFGRLGERYGAQRGIWICIWARDRLRLFSGNRATDVHPGRRDRSRARGYSSA